MILVMINESVFNFYLFLKHWSILLKHLKNMNIN